MRIDLDDTLRVHNGVQRENVPVFAVPHFDRHLLRWGVERRLQAGDKAERGLNYERGIFEIKGEVRGLGSYGANRSRCLWVD